MCLNRSSVTTSCTAYWGTRLLFTGQTLSGRARRTCTPAGNKQMPFLMQGTGKEPTGMPHVLQATGKWTQNQGVASGRSIHHNLGEEGEGQWRAGKGDTGEWMSRGKWEWAWWARPWHANKRKKHVPSHGQTAGNSVQVESVRAYTRRGAWPYYYRLYNSCRAAPTMQSCKCLTYQHTAHSSALPGSSTIYWAGPSDYSQDICKTVQLVSIS